MQYKPLHFIGEPIEVDFVTPLVFEKKPSCPDRFKWKDEWFNISTLISEWHDYTRRGRMSRNMQPQHASVASRRGSWGVGEFYFRVVTDNNRYFDIVYNRAPVNSDKRKGNWILYRELDALQDTQV